MDLKKISRYTLFVAVVILALELSSCKDDDELVITTLDQEFCDSIGSTYSNDVASIIQTRCAISGCHNDSKADGISLQTYEEVKSEASRGRFLKAIKHEPGASWMPYRLTKLSHGQIDIIECWIQNGYPE